MDPIVFRIPQSNVTITIDEDRLPEFTVLKLLHQDNVHTIRIDELTPELARDVQYYIDTGMVTLDDTINMLELLGNNVNVENLPHDMIKMHLAEEYFRREVNKEDSTFRNFEHLIELDENMYEQMRDVAISYREAIPQLLKSQQQPIYPSWEKIQRRIRSIIKKFKKMHCNSFLLDKHYPNYMIAGGSIASILHDEFKMDKQDVDVFIVAPDDKLKTRIADFYADPDHTECFLARNYTPMYNDNVISFKPQESGRRSFEIQIIKRFYKIFDQILHGFDVDASCVGVTFDGKIWMTERFKYAFMKNCLTVNISRLSRTYEARIAKYHARGWDLYIPGTLVESVPPIELELDDGEKIQFSEIESKLDRRWSDLTLMFDSLTQEGKDFLVSKIRANWYRFSGIDLLWITTRPGFKFRSKGYNKTLTLEYNDVWKVDNPDSQHTGSFEPIPRDTRWFNLTIDQYVQAYLPIARLVSKFNLYKRRMTNNQTDPTRTPPLAPTVWRMNLMYEFIIHGTTIYIVDYMLKKFMQYFDVSYSDLKVTTYMNINHVHYRSINYVVDLESELIVGTLHMTSIGLIVKAYPTTSDAESKPRLVDGKYIINDFYGELDLPPFEFSENLTKNYYNDQMMQGDREGRNGMFRSIRYLFYHTYDLSGNEDLIDLEYTLEFVNWFNQKTRLIPDEDFEMFG